MHIEVTLLRYMRYLNIIHFIEFFGASIVGSFWELEIKQLIMLCSEKLTTWLKLLLKSFRFFPSPLFVLLISLYVHA